MPDLLVKLYNIPSSFSVLSELGEKGITVRRAIGPEKNAVVSWVYEKFSDSWASECSVAMSALPSSCFLALKDGEILGFACYDSTAKGFFGPTGVDLRYRGLGIGRALLLRTMEALFEAGYAYAVIGWAGPVEFYRKAVGATVIEDSEPGIYRGLVKKKKP